VVTSLSDRRRSSGRDARPATVAAVLGAWAVCVLLLLFYLQHRPKPTSSPDAAATPPATVFPAPPAGAVVFSREAGPDALALAVVPGADRLHVQASIVGPEGIGVSGLTTSFAVDGVAADGVTCGAGCYRAIFPRNARPRSVEVTTAGELTTRWRVALPNAWPPENAAQMLSSARRVWRNLRSVSYTERLASSPRHLLTSSWQVQAPDRLAYQIVHGYSAVIIGTRRWDKAPGGHWVRSPQQRITQPTPQWTSATDAHVLGAVRAGGRPALKVSFFDPRTPAWFTVALERKTLRALDVRMIATAHFMHDSYRSYNATSEIHPPRG
jgi:hypothetical protein